MFENLGLFYIQLKTELTELEYDWKVHTVWPIWVEHAAVLYKVHMKAYLGQYIIHWFVYFYIVYHI